MSESNSQAVIRLRGVRHNNLKNFDLDLPLHRLIVVTGLSGSGKSSLAFDTLYAEGQRRYIETFSPYARQFFDRMDKPQVDSVEGIPPAIAIEQRNAVRTTRSTVGTMTEICDYMKVLWPHIAQLHCRGCGQLVQKDSPQSIWQQLNAVVGGQRAEVLVTFDLPLSEKLPLDESLGLISKQGYQRLLLNGEVVRLDEAAQHSAFRPPLRALTVIQDRLKLAPTSRARFIEACEQAGHFGKGKLAIHELDPSVPGYALHAPRLFSNRLHCAKCDIEYPDPTPALFNFNHPVGACPACKGFGRIITIDYDLAIPDRSLTLAEGAVRPWRSGFSAECQSDLTKFCKVRRVPMNVPFNQLSSEHQRWVLDGDKNYGIDEDHQWPRLWYGLKGYFRWLESKSYKMHVRVLLSRYRAYTKCTECDGQRFNKDAQLYLLSRPAHLRPRTSDARKPSPTQAGRVVKLGLADFYALSIRDALALVEQLTKTFCPKNASALQIVLEEVRARLAYLKQVGLGYLTLDRPTRTLSGGETERVNLTTCLGTRLVNTLFVLDEPSVGLHPRDTERLVSILEKLRDTGNTVVVVEHEASIMRAADQIVDLGPGHGTTGGEVVYQGTLPELEKSARSLTGQYLSGRKRIEIPARRPVAADANRLKSVSKKNQGRLPWVAALSISNATRHNLKKLSVEIPLNRFVCVTGVSGSGKSTLIHEVLYPALCEHLKSPLPNLKPGPPRASDQVENEKRDEDNPTRNTRNATRLSSYESLGRVVMVDQSGLGKTPRSNPAVYIGAFDDIREVFAHSEAARRRGLSASAFSFNSGVGQCERCRGAGFEKIEMQFLSDVFIRCPDCNGRRYRQHILEVKIRGSPRPMHHSDIQAASSFVPAAAAGKAWSIADVLDATVDEVVGFLNGFGELRAAHRALANLKVLQDVGLGYLRLGQPINTLSGGESQRLKLVAHLAAVSNVPTVDDLKGLNSTSLSNQRIFALLPTLFLFDEPTTGLHFDDVRVLLQVFQRLVDIGHSVVVVEHNLEMIKCADWVIDLGPEAGDGGGQIVAQGTPEEIAACRGNLTGRALRSVLGNKRGNHRKAVKIGNKLLRGAEA